MGVENLPPKVGQGMRKPLQGEEHSTGQASEEVGRGGKRPAQDGLLEAVAQWRRVSREPPGLREHQSPDCHTWRKRTQDQADSEQMDVGDKAPE